MKLNIQPLDEQKKLKINRENYNPGLLTSYKISPENRACRISKKKIQEK